MALWLLCIGVLDKNASMEWTMAIVDLRRVPRILLAVLALAGPAAHAGSIDLQWDPVANATGYEVYYDTQSRQYTFTKDAGNQTTVTVGNLTDCTNYYMAVKAYNGYGELEAYSNGVRLGAAGADRLGAHRHAREAAHRRPLRAELPTLPPRLGR